MPANETSDITDDALCAAERMNAKVDRTRTAKTILTNPVLSHPASRSWSWPGDPWLSLWLTLTSSGKTRHN
jgi:hypothetical protein